MKKFLLFLPLLLFGSEIRYAYSDLHAFLPQKGSLSIVAEFQKINDTLDIFNIKDQELKGSIAKYASIGDMEGAKVAIGYGWNDGVFSHVSFQEEHIDYGSGNLKNQSLDLYVRVPLLQTPLGSKILSIDIGSKLNRAKPIIYDRVDLLNSLAQKIDDRFKLIHAKNGYFIIKPSSGEYLKLDEKPSVKLDDLKDRSFYLRLLLERRVNHFFYIGAFSTVYYTDIKTSITANSELLKRARENGYDLDINLDRDEKSLELGLFFTYGTKWLLEGRYGYSHFFRDKGLGYVNYNHTIALEVVKPVGLHTFVYIGGKIMYRQFNGEIPYLYNRYSQSTFDHKYGYAKIGIGYEF